MSLLQLTTNIEQPLQQSGVFAYTGLGPFASKILHASILIAGVLLLAYLIWGALDWLISEGNPEEVKKARGKILHATIGFALLASIYVLWRIAINFFGLQSWYSGGGATGGGNPPGPSVVCNAQQEAQFNRQACIDACFNAKNCRGANCRTNKNEYGIRFCECAPGPGQQWNDLSYSRCVP